MQDLWGCPVGSDLSCWCLIKLGPEQFGAIFVLWQGTLFYWGRLLLAKVLFLCFVGSGMCQSNIESKTRCFSAEHKSVIHFTYCGWSWLVMYMASLSSVWIHLSSLSRIYTLLTSKECPLSLQVQMQVDCWVLSWTADSSVLCHVFVKHLTSLPYI